MAITNGAGLVIKPIATSTYNGTTRTAPYLYTDLATIIGPNYYIDTPLRIWMYISADNITANADNGGWFLDNFGTSNTIAQSAVYRSASGGTKAWISGSVFNGASLSIQTCPSPLDNTDRVVVSQIPLGQYQGVGTGYSAAYSSGWPTLQALRPIFRGSTPNANISIATQDIVTGLPMKFGFTAMRVGSATALSVTIARIRIDFRNPN